MGACGSRFDNNVWKLVITAISEQFIESMKRAAAGQDSILNVVKKYETNEVEKQELVELIDTHYDEAFNAYEALEADNAGEIVQTTTTTESVHNIVKLTARSASNTAVAFYEKIISDSSITLANDIKETIKKKFNAEITKGVNLASGNPYRVTTQCLQWNADGAPSGKVKKEAILLHLFKYTTYQTLGNTSGNHVAVASPTAPRAGNASTTA